LKALCLLHNQFQSRASVANSFKISSAGVMSRCYCRSSREASPVIYPVPTDCVCPSELG